MKKFLPTLLLLSLVFTPPAFPRDDDPSLAVAQIPDSLKNGADAVIRYSQTVMTIRSEKNISLHHHYAVTVINKNGLVHGVFREMYDKTSRLSHFRGTVFDASGKRLEKLSPSDLKDVSATDASSLYVDSRIKIYLPDTKDFPFTVEYEFDEDLNGTVMYPRWIPQDAYYLGVEKASFRVVAPPDKMVRYEGLHLKEPQRSEKEGQQVLTWQVSRLTPLHPEPMSVSLTDRVPVLYLAPRSFYYAHSRGDMSSWAGMAEWIAGLNRGRRDLPEETRQRIRELTASCSTTPEKARRVYQYMQQHTRYVSVQLGIGGYQPYPASYVDEKGYGDCKALCNYTCALMEAAGVDARYVLVKAGSTAGDILTGFPSNQFNHIIVSIPSPEDTLWLECTSQSQPFGFLGSFTADRHALMITGDSGMLVHTPRYGEKDNTQYRHAVVQVKTDGSASAVVNTRYAGLQYENVQQALSLKGEDLKDFYYKQLNIPHFLIREIALKEQINGTLPIAEEHAVVEMKKYMTIQGKRAFLPLNLMNKTDFIPRQDGERRSDIYLYFPFTDVDTIVWKIPPAYEVQYAPPPVKISSPFGDYESRVETTEDREIIYIRRLTLRKGRYPREMFGALQDFGKKVTRADRKKVLLKIVL